MCVKKQSPEPDGSINWGSLSNCLRLITSISLSFLHSHDDGNALRSQPTNHCPSEAVPVCLSPNDPLVSLGFDCFRSLGTPTVLSPVRLDEQHHSLVHQHSLTSRLDNCRTRSRRSICLSSYFANGQRRRQDNTPIKPTASFRPFTIPDVIRCTVYRTQAGSA